MSAGTPGRSSRWRGDRRDEDSAAYRLSPSLPGVAYSSMVQQVPLQSFFQQTSPQRHGDTEKLPLLKFELRGESILAQSFTDCVALLCPTPTGLRKWFLLSVPPCLRVSVVGFGNRV